MLWRRNTKKERRKGAGCGTGRNFFPNILGLILALGLVALVIHDKSYREVYVTFSVYVIAHLMGVGDGSGSDGT